MPTNTKKQQLLIEYLVSSVDTYAVCKAIVDPQYFDPELRKTVEFIHQYYDSYGALPSVYAIEAETDVGLTLHQPTRDQLEYCANEVESFCRRKAMQQAVIQAYKHIENDDYGSVEQLIKSAMAVSLNRDLGITYFEDPLDRLEKQSKTPLRTPTKWTEFDAALNGGIARKEILLFSANSGGGKSITLSNIAVNMLEQGFNVMYVSLELSEELISQRFDAMFSGIPTVLSQHRYRDIASSLINIAPNVGQLQIKHMPSGTTANSIRAYIKEYELTTGCVPDVLIVDYLDIMGANEKVSADNVWEKDKRATEQLRDIAFEYDLFVCTASQQNRAAIDNENPNQSHIAGGLSKVNTVDVYVSIIMTAKMKAAGQMAFSFLKTRNSDGVGKTIHMKWRGKDLRILDGDSSSEPIQEDVLSTINKKPKSSSLMDFISTMHRTDND